MVDDEEQKRIAVGQPGHRGLRRLRRLDQPDDAGIGTVGGAPRDPQIKGIARVRRAAHHVLAAVQTHGHGLARQSGLVQHRPVAFDRAIHGRHIALPDQKKVVRCDVVQRYLVKRAIAVPRRCPGHAGQKVAHLAPGAALGKTLQKGAARIHQRDHRRRERLAKEKRRRHGQRRHDVEPDLAFRETAHDLDQKGGKDGHDTRRPGKSSRLWQAGNHESETCNQPERCNGQ